MDSSLKHIAFILDGNRRWAERNGVKGVIGHKKGYENAKTITELLPKYGVQYVTFFVFSTENWNRSSEEVSYLFGLFQSAFDSRSYFDNHGIRVISIGDLSKLPDELRVGIHDIEEMTKNNSTITFVIAVNYGGRDEIVRAVRKISQDIKEEKRAIEDISEDVFSSYLDTYGIPDPDAVVRTSEHRISNFLLWQIAYSEIFFVNKLWPDFNEDDLKAIVNEFSQRKRRYGK